MSAKLKERVLSYFAEQGETPTFVNTATIATALNMKRGQVMPALNKLVKEGQLEKRVGEKGKQPEWCKK